MSLGQKSPLALLGIDRLRTADEDRVLADACLQSLAEYRAAVAIGKASPAITARARRAFLHLGGDPARASASLKDYNHERYGPFLGVSDEGSAAGQIRDAGCESPKMRALSRSSRSTPLVVGVAVDAERLGGGGRLPREYHPQTHDGKTGGRHPARLTRRTLGERYRATAARAGRTGLPTGDTASHQR